MRSVLVCVRTPLAAQNIAAIAARLGMAGAVRTAASDPEVMLRLTERPADVVLADTALTRPDSIGFVRRVLARSPGAAVLLFGMEDRGAAAAAVAAGARGLIQGGDHDLVSVVAKAMLLLAGPGRAAARGWWAGGDGAAVAGRPAGAARASAENGPGRPGTATTAPLRAVPENPPLPGVGNRQVPAGAGSQAAAGGVGPQSAGGAPVGGAGIPPVVPVQRAEDVAGENPPADGPGDAEAGVVRPATEPGGPSRGPAGARPRLNLTPDARFARGESDGGQPRGGAGQGGPACRISLTERERQVLLGMADGKSNAEIGRELYVSEDTVKTHARRLFRKLGARDRAHAVAAGFRAGLVA